jgi:huntingtin-interacting protein 1-related protein
LDSGSAPDLPARPTKTPPPVAASPDQSTINEQARMLKEYEEQQAALRAAQEAEGRRRQELEEQQRREFEQRQQEQAERERLAQEQLLQQQMMQYNNQAADQVHGLEREILALRGQFDRDQLMLEQYDRVCLSLKRRL